MSEYGRNILESKLTIFYYILYYRCIFAGGFCLAKLYLYIERDEKTPILILLFPEIAIFHSLKEYLNKLKLNIKDTLTSLAKADEDFVNKRASASADRVFNGYIDFIIEHVKKGKELSPEDDAYVRDYASSLKVLSTTAYIEGYKNGWNRK